MYRLTGAACACVLSFAAWSEQPPTAEHADKSWIERSNAYTNRLLQVQLEHSPESASQQGVAKFDERISNPTLADELAERHELEAVKAKVDAEGAKETDQRVQEDLAILDKAFDLRFRRQDYELQHKVPFL